LNELTEEQVSRWIYNRDCLAAMTTMRGKPRHLNGATIRNNPAVQFPLSPHLKADREMAERVAAAMESMTNHRKLFIDIVRHFIDNYSVSENGIPCREDRELKRYVRFMRLVGIPDNQMRITVVLPRTQNSRSIVTVQKQFANKTGLPAACLSIRSLHSTEYSRQGERYIQALNPPPSGENARTVASYGFRYALYLYAIANLGLL
jgi:hypothetical protein